MTSLETPKNSHPPAVEECDAGLAFYPSQLLSLSLPTRETGDLSWQRTNGKYKLVITAGSIDNGKELEHVLPSGKYARMALLYLTTLATKTKQTSLPLLPSRRAFLDAAGVTISGMASNEALRQLQAILAMTITIHKTVYNKETGEGDVETCRILVAKNSKLSFNSDGEIVDNEGNRIQLSEDFYHYFVESSAVPLSLSDWRRVMGKTKSPLAIDIYGWLWYRMQQVDSDQHISWEKLYEQLGSNNKDIRGFRRDFQKALAVVEDDLPGLRLTVAGQGKRSGFRGVLLHNSPVLKKYIRGKLKQASEKGIELGEKGSPHSIGA